MRDCLDTLALWDHIGYRGEHPNKKKTARLWESLAVLVRVHQGGNAERLVILGPTKLHSSCGAPDGCRRRAATKACPKRQSHSNPPSWNNPRAPCTSTRVSRQWTPSEAPLV